MLETDTGRIWVAQNRPAVQGRPPLLLIHGAGGNHLSWPPQLCRLAKESVWVMDLPGHGRSDGPGCQSVEDYAAAVVGLLDALDMNQAVVGGHSMGGAIAQTIALDYPERVAGLVLMGTGAKLRVAPALLDTVLNNFELSLALVAKWSFGPAAPAESRQLGIKVMKETGSTVLYGDFLACERFDVSDRLAEIQVPTLVIGGTADKMTPLKFSRSLAAGIPNARLESVEGAGHMFVLERPDPVAAAVAQFMTSLS